MALGATGPARADNGTMSNGEHVCTYCQTRMPAADLAHSEAGGWQCLDITACSARADAAGLYAASESELEVSARESRQGALR